MSISTKTKVQRRRPPSPLSVVTLIVLLGLVVAPLVMVFIGAFLNGAPGLPKSDWSLKAILSVYASPDYLWPLVGTLILAVVTAGLSVVIGTLFAWLVARTNMFIRRVLEWGVILPLFISPFIGAVAWNLLGAPRSGIINTNLRWLLGLDDDAVLINISTMPGVVFVMLLYFMPYAYQLVGSSLRNMDPGLEEASYMNGRGIIATAFKVTLPIVRPALTAAFFMIAILATGVFTIPLALGVNTGFAPLGMHVYLKMTQFPVNPPVAAAIGTLIFWLTLLGIYFYRRSIRNARRFVTLGGKATRRREVKLGWMRVPATVLVALFGLFAAVLPIIALLITALTPYAMTDFRSMQFSLETITQVLGSIDVWNSLLNTVWLSLLAPTLAVLVAFAVAYVVVRERGRLGGALDYLATFPVAVPGIVFAMGILWLYIRTPIYATVAVLTIALVAAFLPTATRFSTTGLMQIDPSLEEAARMSGASRMRAALTITLPLVRPAILAAWSLLFIFASREVNETVLLALPSTRPLAVLAWDHINANDPGAAAVVSILLMLFMAAGLLIARFVFRTRLDSSNL
ncbi:MAG: iron ABC transporter permease [Microbacteriaceae bacterium]|nr:iron ABC transporter permease [Microbacteriaceae bacterium]